MLSGEAAARAPAAPEQAWRVVSLQMSGCAGRGLLPGEPRSAAGDAGSGQGQGRGAHKPATAAPREADAFETLKKAAAQKLADGVKEQCLKRPEDCLPWPGAWARAFPPSTRRAEDASRLSISDRPKIRLAEARETSYVAGCFFDSRGGPVHLFSKARAARGVTSGASPCLNSMKTPIIPRPPGQQRLRPRSSPSFRKSSSAPWPTPSGTPPISRKS